MDAREALRRYLEQRRDLGESELVLDTLSVDEALKLIGAAAPSVSAAPAGAASEASAPTADWRAALRQTGIAPPAQASPTTPAPVVPAALSAPAGEPPAKVSIPRYAFPAPAEVPAAGGGESGEPLVALAEVQAGLSVGGGPRTQFGDPAAGLTTLEEIAATVAGCTRCTLYKSAKNPVPGTGNPNANFMVCGEAPGADEDEQGVPFVGASGQLLTKILEAINLKRDEVFIANVLKHRPPGNRNPLPEEVIACSPYLIRQIELIRPKVILALGSFAAQTLLETKLTIGKLRGQIHRYHGVPLVVTYHPAALLRNPSWKRPTWEDVKLARRIFDSTVSPGA